MTERPGRRAVVRGASRGIGAAIAERLAQGGLAVAINFSGNPVPAQALADKIARAGGHTVAIKADVNDPAALRDLLFDRAEAAFGGVDVLVNNAGILRLSPLADADDAPLDRMVAVNLRGVFNGLREGARRRRDGGRIINFSSSVVGLSPPTYAVYAATKAGVEAMTHILARELRGRHITMNAVAPGPTATDLFLDGKSPEAIDMLARQAPLERLGTPEDIAGVVAFLAGPDGPSTSG